MQCCRGHDITPPAAQVGNGTQGVVRRIHYAAGEDPDAPGVWPMLVVDVPTYKGPALYDDARPTWIPFVAVSRECDKCSRCKMKGLPWRASYATTVHKYQGGQFGPGQRIERGVLHLGTGADGPAGVARGSKCTQCTRATTDDAWALAKPMPLSYWLDHNNSYHCRQVRAFDKRLARLSSATCGRWRQLWDGPGADDAFRELLLEFDAACAPVAGQAPRRQAGPTGGTAWVTAHAAELGAYAAWAAAIEDRDTEGKKARTRAAYDAAYDALAGAWDRAFGDSSDFDADLDGERPSLDQKKPLPVFTRRAPTADPPLDASVTPPRGAAASDSAPSAAVAAAAGSNARARAAAHRVAAAARADARYAAANVRAYAARRAVVTLAPAAALS